MESLMDVDQQPPYVEIYSDAPLMCASLVNTRQAMSSSSLPELVNWCHGVHRTVDAVANSLGLCKVKALGDDSLTCLFSISPDMPSRQQAEVMLHAAQQLLATLSQVQLPGPDGGQLAVKVTIHAGKYAGAVVGRSAWTYDLFGEDVLLLLDMDRVNSANCILVSDAALGLISSGPGRQFTPVCKVACEGGREVQMHALTGQVGSSSNAQQGTQQLPAPLLPAAAAQRALPSAQRLSPGDEVVPAMSSHWQQQRLEQPVQQQPQQQQQRLEQPVQQQPQRAQQPQQQQELSAAIAAAQSAAKCAQWQPQRSSNATTSHQAIAPPQAAATSSSAAAVEDETPASRTMQPNLLFADPVLESAYMEFQRQPLASMDLLFILLTLGVTLFSFRDPNSGYPLSRGQLLLASSGQWLLLLVAAVWLLCWPRSYSRWREALWVAHRLLAAVHVAVLGLLSILLQQGMMLGAGSGPAGAATAAAAAAVLKGVLGLHRGKGLALLAEQLGLKVRFRSHVLSSTMSCALLVFSTACFHSSSSGVLPVWQLAQHVLVGWAAPTALLYLWESEDRLRYLEGLEQQRNKADCHAAKCKDV